MRRLRNILVWAGAAALIPVLASAQRSPDSWPPAQGSGLVNNLLAAGREHANLNASLAPGTTLAAPLTRVGPDEATAGLPTRAIAYPLVLPYGAPDYVATPEVLSRISDLLAAIDNPDERSRIAKQWLDYSRKVIEQDLQYRQEWLALQKAQLAQQQTVEQLRLEVAQLQAQVEALRTQNAQLEQQSLQARAQRGQGTGLPTPSLQ